MTDFAHARREMIEGQIRPSGVFDLRVLDAINSVPREVFLNKDQMALAYLDKEQALNSNCDRQMSSPATMAKLIELAEISAQDIVLDIACGTGYSTAVIAQLANSVVAIESETALVDRANQILADLNISNAAVVHGALSKGVPSEAPFDVIIIQGAVDEVPKTLFDQLRNGGRLVGVEGTGNSATASVHVKSKYGTTRISSFNISIPPLKEFAKKSQFVF